MKLLSELQFKLNLHADINDIREYYNELSTRFQHRRWSLTNTENIKHVDEQSWNGFRDVDATLIPGGWAITPYFKDDNIVCPPYRVTNHKPTVVDNVGNELLFGFAERFVSKVPMAKWLAITDLNPTGAITPHVDPFWHIHIPIYSSPDSHFIWNTDDGSEMYSSTFDADGSIWACNTMHPHSVKNNSNKLRVHFIFRVEDEDIPELIKLSGKI